MAFSHWRHFTYPDYAQFFTQFLTLSGPLKWYFTNCSISNTLCISFCPLPMNMDGFLYFVDPMDPTSVIRALWCECKLIVMNKKILQCTTIVLLAFGLGGRPPNRKVLSESQVGRLGTFPILHKEDEDRWCTTNSFFAQVWWRKGGKMFNLFDWEEVTM